MNEDKRGAGEGGWHNFYPGFKRQESPRIWEESLQAVGDRLFSSGGRDFNLKTELREAGIRSDEWIWVRSDGRVFSWQDARSKLTERELACFDYMADSYFRTLWENRLRVISNLKI